MSIKKIVFANQKGGTGKTSLLLIIADYLKRNNQDIVVFDTDSQKSIYSFAQFDRELELEDRYPVYSFNLEEIENYLSTADEYYKEKNLFVLIDTAGLIDKDNIKIIQLGDFIIVPFDYSDVAFASTLVFVDIVSYLKMDMKKLILVPNKINLTAKQTKVEKFYKVLEEKSKDINVFMNVFKQSIIVNNIRSLYVEYKTNKDETLYIYDDILKLLIEKING